MNSEPSKNISSKFNIPQRLLAVIRNSLKKLSIGEQLVEEAFSPPRIALMGKTGVGKTSTINALFNPTPPLPTGHVRATTKVFQEVKIPLGENRGEIIIVDCPGLCESLNSDEKIIPSYKELLDRCDVILWVMKADDRTLAIEQRYMRDLFVNELKDRLVIGVNQVDLMPPYDWSTEYNLPSRSQEENIREKIEDIKEKLKDIDIEPRAVLPYSVRYSYRLTRLFKEMLDACPENRVLALSSKRKISLYSSPKGKKSSV